MIMRNDSAQLTPLGEWVYSGILAVLFIGMGYAIVKAFAIGVVRLGQVLGII
jgi:hypothetical protein